MQQTLVEKGLMVGVMLELEAFMNCPSNEVSLSLNIAGRKVIESLESVTNPGLVVTVMFGLLRNFLSLSI